MHKFINEMNNGDDVCGFYLCKNYFTQKKATGEDYFRVEISDKSGSCQCLCWEDPKKFDVDVKSIGQIIKIKGTMGEYKGAGQLRIYNIRNSRDEDKNEFEVANIVSSAPIDEKAYENDIVNMITSIEDGDYRNVCKAIYEEIKQEFLTIPAGKTVHHSFRCGLLMHTTNMMKLSKVVAELYSNIIDEDLLMAATFLHDIAKIQEFELSELSVVSDYSKEGQLLGHLYLGALKVKEVCDKLKVDESKSLLLQHLILSHHGDAEKGSPVTPKCAEAEALHIIDLLDSRLEIYSEEYEQLKLGQISTKKNWALDHKIMRNK